MLFTDLTSTDLCQLLSYSHGSARVLQGRRRKSMGKWKIRPLATPKPLKRSSQKVAHLIMSWISTDIQNLVTIPQGVSFSRMREIAHQNVYSASFLSGFFQRATAYTPEPIFTRNTSNNAVPSNDVPFRG